MKSSAKVFGEFDENLIKGNDCSRFFLLFHSLFLSHTSVVYGSSHVYEISDYVSRTGGRAKVCDIDSRVCHSHTYNIGEIESARHGSIIYTRSFFLYLMELFFHTRFIWAKKNLSFSSSEHEITKKNAQHHNERERRRQGPRASHTKYFKEKKIRKGRGLFVFSLRKNSSITRYRR